MERFQWSKERRRRVVSHDLSSNTGISSQEGAVARAFLTALESQDFHRMKACFHPDIHFRALVPAGGPRRRWSSGNRRLAPEVVWEGRCICAYESRGRFHRQPLAHRLSDSAPENGWLAS